MSARNPYDGREMRPNGQSHMSAYTLRGVRKMSRFVLFKIYRLIYFYIVISILACQLDIVFALSDTPFTGRPYSQKRLAKSIERSSAWLSNLLQLILR